LNPPEKNILLDYIKIGTPVKKAVVAAGISEKSFYNWMTRGFTERERLATVPNAKPNTMRLYFFNFYSELSKQEQRLSLRKLLSLLREWG
jgi:hypothetical protein